MKKKRSKKFFNILPRRKVIYKKKPGRKKKVKKFPINFRFIPDFSHSPLKKIFWNKYFFVSFLSTFISVAIVMQGIDLTRHVGQLQDIRSEREEIGREIAYWEGVVASHADYRDGYFKLALLEYRLGHSDRARSYIEKTLAIDPNFKPARDFSQKIGRERKD